MQTKVEKQPKSTIKLTVMVSNEDVKKTYEKVLEEYVKNAEIPGFRKGMAPKDMVKEKTDLNKLYGDVINDLLQENYTQAVKENKIIPVANPRVEIKNFDLEKDFEFTAVVPTRPDIKIGDYMSKLKELQKNKEKETKELNAKKLASGEKLEDTHTHLSPGEVIRAIVDSSEVEISDILVDEETERMLARLVDQAQSIGLSLDQYLKAQNKTIEQLKGDYAKMAEETLKSEFALAQLVRDNHIEVSDEEIVELVKASGDERALEQLKNPVEKWYIKSIIEKNKLINKIIEEVAHEDEHQ